MSGNREARRAWENRKSQGPAPRPRRRRHGHVAGPDRAPCGPTEGQADPKSLSVTGNPTRTGSERGRERGREVVGLKRREAGTAGTDCGMDAVTWAGCPHGTSSREKDKGETVFSCRRPRKGPWQVAWAARWVNGSQHPCPLRASLPAQPPEGRAHWVCSQPVPPGPQTESPAHPPGATGSRSEHGAGSPRSERGEACALRPLGLRPRPGESIP